MNEMKTQIMVDTIQRLLSFCRKHKIKIREILVDGQFKSSRTDLAELQINLNCVYTDKHL